MNAKKKFNFLPIRLVKNIVRNECEITGKICYSKREAGEIKNQRERHLNGDNLGRNKTLPRRSYYCKYCGCFHLTHVPFFRKNETRRRIRFYDSDC